MIIAVDASGGDYAPSEIIKGAVQAVEENDIEIILVGKKSLIHVTAARHLKKTKIFNVGANEVIEVNKHPLKGALQKPPFSFLGG